MNIPEIVDKVLEKQATLIPGPLVTINAHEWSAFLDGVKAGKMSDMHVLGRSDRDLDGGVMQTLFKTKATWVSFSDKELDAQLEAASSAVDPAKRKAAMDQLQQKVIGLVAWIFLWQQHDIYGVSSRLQWEPRADEQNFLYLAKVK